MNAQSDRWKQYLSVAVFAILGALARQGVEILLPPIPGNGFPLATLLINWSGAFFLAWFYTITIWRWRLPQWLRTGVGTGFVGSYTTFSTFMVESDGLFAHGAPQVAVLYLALSLLGGFALALLGVRLAGEKTEEKILDQ
ncbi:fluoride efflux transporter FluC [Sulfoacidibacillus thermotolerans]|uniref:Fluoride-specific ion channel FluC n=1 Tax=Sulfoacidibacillus thermotolerans TaxID=1765684 RepID=A0A2U3DBA2_SULT2|nr:CrcB family protein [Sulfoacidibacillus thermotolerans]PWI58556.1 hypothetical protein BM613_03310 [Sulfoacidibacillus thermotolerans]